MWSNRGWQDSILDARSAIGRLLRDSPSLRREVSEMIAPATEDARDLAARRLRLNGETPRVQLGTLSYSEDQVLGDWFP